MQIAEIQARLEELTQAAKARRALCAADFACLLGGADIDFMTADERAERHRLVLMLPTRAEEIQAAKARIQLRVAQRKNFRGREKEVAP
jgi:hypothetical protein